MKRQFLKDMGLTDEQVEQIMKENGLDVQAEQAKIAAKEQELVTANNTITQLQNTAKQYEGVDVKELQRQLDEAQANYDSALKAAKVDSAVTLALTNAKAKNLVAARALLAEFLKTAELDENGGVKGLDEQLKTLREDKTSAFLFEAEAKPTPKLTGFVPAEGLGSLDANGGGNPATLKDAIEASMAKAAAQEGAAVT